MVIIEPQGGLANRMRLVASGLHLKRQLDCRLRCIWLEDYFLKAPFDALFEPIAGLEVRHAAGRFRYLQASRNPNPVKRALAWIWNQALGLDCVLVEPDVKNWILQNQIDVASLARHYRTLYLQTTQEFGMNHDEFRHFVPVPAIRHKLAEVTAQFAPRTMGIHIRRTDNYQAIEHSPTELFIRKMDEEVAHDAGVRFFLATDDPTVEAELQHRYGDRIVTQPKVLNRHTLRGIQDAVVDLFALSRTVLIYGSYWSSFSDVAARLGPTPFMPLKT